MAVYRVVRKSDGEEVNRYAAMQVVEGDWPFAEYDHVEVNETVEAPAVTPKIVTKGGFIKRFSVEEYATIKAAAQQNAMLDYYWQQFMLAENIDLSDPDTVAGVTMLEQAGLIAQGRAQEILNGE
jgi:hypothetical protein